VGIEVSHHFTPDTAGPRGRLVAFARSDAAKPSPDQPSGDAETTLNAFAEGRQDRSLGFITKRQNINLPGPHPID
jgi:hypothetical protein